MRVTLLGTGDATGVPAPLCDCEYCQASDRRRRPALLVETPESTVVFDCGPEIAEQLHKADVSNPDAFFLTHAHGDHAAGIPHIHQSAKWDANHLANVQEFRSTDPDAFATDYTIHLTDTAYQHLFGSGVFDRINYCLIGQHATVSLGDLQVGAFPVDHHPDYETLGFVVSSGDRAIGYAPDMRSFLGSPPAAQLDLFVCEGAAVLGRPVHGPRDELLAAIRSVSTELVVLVNVNEHLQRAHTDSLRETAEKFGFEIGADFAVYDLQ